MNQLPYPISYPVDLAAEMTAHQDRTREILEISIALLEMSEPDTFLGRQHYPLIPLPHEKE